MFYEAPLTAAVYNDNIGIIQLLLQCPDIDPNTKSILQKNYFFYIISNYFIFNKTITHNVYKTYHNEVKIIILFKCFLIKFQINRFFFSYKVSNE